MNDEDFSYRYFEVRIPIVVRVRVKARDRVQALRRGLNVLEVFEVSESAGRGVTAAISTDTGDEQDVSYLGFELDSSKAQAEY